MDEYIERGVYLYRLSSEWAELADKIQDEVIPEITDQDLVKEGYFTDADVAMINQVCEMLRDFKMQVVSENTDGFGHFELDPYLRADERRN